MKFSRLLRFGQISAMLMIMSMNGYASSPNPQALFNNDDYFHQAWDVDNDPLLLGNFNKRNFYQLPKSATLSEQPWNDSYWPSYKGGIAYRWNTEKGTTPFRMPLKSKQQLLSMSQQEIATLSPAEKYDILKGRYDYPTVKNELGRTSPDQPQWFGLCHGWAAAAGNFTEPKPISLKSVDGITIPFGSADIKALLTFYQGQIAYAPTRFLGTRCNIDLSKNPERATYKECEDTNAGSFHVALINQLAFTKKPFVADISRDAEVWNFPIFGFETKVIKESNGASATAAPGTVKEVEVQTSIYYTALIDAQWDATKDTENQVYDEQTYRYRLELNAQNEIIGGEWLTFERPDFLWIQEKPRFQGYYQQIELLIN